MGHVEASLAELSLQLGHTVEIAVEVEYVVEEALETLDHTKPGRLVGVLTAAMRQMPCPDVAGWRQALTELSGP